MDPLPGTARNVGRAVGKVGSTLRGVEASPKVRTLFGYGRRLPNHAPPFLWNTDTRLLVWLTPLHAANALWYGDPLHCRLRMCGRAYVAAHVSKCMCGCTCVTSAVHRLYTGAFPAAVARLAFRAVVARLAPCCKRPTGQSRWLPTHSSARDLSLPT
eukprot:200310-Chlamydomonas_euryale.AAC.1